MEKLGMMCCRRPKSIEGCSRRRGRGIRRIIIINF